MALIKGIHHVALKCCSSEEYKNVAEFYGDILGLSVARKWDGGIMFDTGDGIIEVFEDGESPLPQGNIRHCICHRGCGCLCFGSEKGRI